jgi:hypothetical protein
LSHHTEVAEKDLQDAFRVGLDCLPENRRRLLLAAAEGQSVSALSIPETVRRRELEELEALGILQQGLGEPASLGPAAELELGRGTTWKLTARVEGLLGSAGVFALKRHEARDSQSPSEPNEAALVGAVANH